MKKLVIIVFFSVACGYSQTISQADLDRFALAGVTQKTSPYSYVTTKSKIIDYPVVQTLSVTPGTDITTTLQTAIDAASSANPDGGAIVVPNGTYYINSFGWTSGTGNTRYGIRMANNIEIRGASRSGTKLISRIQGESGKATAIFGFDNVSYAGLRNLTVQWDPNTTCEPWDDIRWIEDHPGDTQADFDAAEQLLADQGNNFLKYNDEVPPGCLLDEFQLDVVSCIFESDATDNWTYQIDIIESGSDPWRSRGDHNEAREVFVNRAYRKDGGKAYFSVHGDDNLIIDSIIMRIRHILFSNFGSLRPTFNVGCNILTDRDWNAHENDDEKNILENSVIEMGGWSGNGALPFQTGSPGLHSPPGANNWTLNNTVSTARGGNIIQPNPGDNGGPNEDLDISVQGRIYEFQTGLYQEVWVSEEAVPASGQIYSPGTTIGYWTVNDFDTYGLNGFSESGGNGMGTKSSTLIKM